MNARACRFVQILTLLLYLRFDASAAPPKNKPIAFAPARGHYAKLGQLDPQPAGPGLPIDANKWQTDPKFIEKVEHLAPEFVQVPLETFVLPPCPANSSKQT